jgi:hypothetical protein
MPSGDRSRAPRDFSPTAPGWPLGFTRTRPAGRTPHQRLRAGWPQGESWRASCSRCTSCGFSPRDPGPMTGMRARTTVGRVPGAAGEDRAGPRRRAGTAPPPAETNARGGPGSSGSSQPTWRHGPRAWHELVRGPAHPRSDGSADGAPTRWVGAAACDRARCDRRGRSHGATSPDRRVTAAHVSRDRNQVAGASTRRSSALEARAQSSNSGGESVECAGVRSALDRREGPRPAGEVDARAAPLHVPLRHWKRLVEVVQVGHQPTFRRGREFEVQKNEASPQLCTRRELPRLDRGGLDPSP